MARSFEVLLTSPAIKVIHNIGPSFKALYHNGQIEAKKEGRKNK